MKCTILHIYLYNMVYFGHIVITPNDSDDEYKIKQFINNPILFSMSNTYGYIMLLMTKG